MCRDLCLEGGKGDEKECADPCILCFERLFDRIVVRLGPLRRRGGENRVRPASPSARVAFAARSFPAVRGRRGASPRCFAFRGDQGRTAGIRFVAVSPPRVLSCGDPPFFDPAPCGFAGAPRRPRRAAPSPPIPRRRATGNSFRLQIGLPNGRTPRRYSCPPPTGRVRRPPFRQPPRVRGA